MSSRELEGLHIAILVDQFPTQSETFIADHALALIERGVNVSVVAMRRPENPPRVDRRILDRVRYAPNITTRRSALIALSGLVWRKKSLGPLWIGRGAFRLRFILASLALGDLKPDVIHAHFGPNGVVAAMLRRSAVTDAKLVTTFHGYDLTEAVEPSESSEYPVLFRSGDLFLVGSQAMKERLTGLGCRPDRIRVHHIPIDLDRFTYRPRAANSDQELRLVSIGRLIEKKGFDDGIRAVAELVRSGLSLRYDIYGQGELETELRLAVARAGIEPVVRFHGWIEHSEVPSVLAEHEVLLAPSVVASNGDREGTPTVVLEAMAVGLVPIGTNHEGIPEQIDDGESGFVVPERDPAAIAGAIRVLAESRDRLRAMSPLARAKVEREFDRQQLTNDLVLVYRSLVDEGTASSER
jgi:colanic acid/amylovoran biosynthesis glycosyltransferase